MRVVLATRVFAPEPAAASFRLLALATAMAEAGHEVDVLTSRLPRDLREAVIDNDQIRIRRFWVLRDRTGSVRGYLPYLSFDLPLFFRLLFMRRADVVVVEPPPTTGLAVSIAAAIRRFVFVYYAADVLADAAQSAGAPKTVVRGVRYIERVVWGRARLILSVSQSVSERLVQLGIEPTKVVTVGNGVDIDVFSPDGSSAPAPTPYALYAGTASEVHGAGVFVDAIVEVPELRLVFVGAGAEFEELRRRAEAVAPGRVEFHHTVAPADIARWFRGAVVALASVKPEGGYQFAFPTKLYAAAASGAPLLFSGAGPGGEFARSAPLGQAVPHDPKAVAGALQAIAARKADETQRRAQASWAREHVDLDAVARRAADAVVDTLSKAQNS